MNFSKTNTLTSDPKAIHLRNGYKFLRLTVGTADVEIQLCKETKPKTEGDYFTIEAGKVYHVEADEGYFLYVVAKTDSASTLKVEASNDRFFRTDEILTPLSDIKNYIYKGTGSEVPANTSMYDLLTFKQRPAAILNQAAPVQNNWYTVYDSSVDAQAPKGIRLISMALSVTVAGETLEYRLTIDGTTYTNAGALNAVFNTNYWLIRYNDSGWSTFWHTTNDFHNNVNQSPFLFECRTLKIEIRKTTANGAGNIKANANLATR